MATYSNMLVGIIGGGPAGLAAVIALGCKGVPALVVSPILGGRYTPSPLIENIPGAGNVSGEEWNTRLVTQAKQFGMQWERGEGIAVWNTPNGMLRIVYGHPYTNYVRQTGDMSAVVIATGVQMHLCPVAANPHGCHDAIVVGSGDAAVQMALHRAAEGRQTTLVTQDVTLSGCSVYLRERLATSRVKIVQAVYLLARHAEKAQTFLLTDTQGYVHEFYDPSVDYFVGGHPTAAALFGVARDERGFVATNALSPFETSRPHVYAIGDVRSASIKTVAVAVGEGTSVGHIIAKRLKGE